MSSLYTEFRPKYFEDVVGQTHVKTVLKAELLSGNTSHAYLFIGPRGTGKTTMARILAQAVNCENLSKEGEPCGKCESCKMFAKNRFIDLIEIDAASNRGIDEIRSLKEKVQYNPSQGKKKIYIIDEVHMLTREAFNALLKTLEEPPKYVMFILATTEPHKVPATIISRCEKFEFRFGSESEILESINRVADSKKIIIEDQAKSLIIRHSGGSFRDALTVLDSVLSTASNNELKYEDVRTALGLPDDTLVEIFLESVIKGDQQHLYKILDKIFSKGINASQFIKTTIGVLRDSLYGISTSSTLDSFLGNVPQTILISWVEMLVDAFNQQRLTFDSKLPLQLVALKMQLSINNNKNASNITNNMGGNNEGETIIKEQEQISKTKKPIVDVSSSIDKSIDENSRKTEQEEDIKKSTENLSIPNEKIKKKDAESTITVDLIKSRWETFMKTIRDANYSLYTFVIGARIKAVTYDTELNVNNVHIAVGFDFHKKQLDNAKNQVLLNSSAVKIYGMPLKFVCAVSMNREVPTGFSESDFKSENSVQSTNTVIESQKPELEDTLASVMGSELEVV